MSIPDQARSTATSLMEDVRYGLRSLLHQRGFAVVAVLTLALGVGANTAVFSVLRAVVLRDLPYRDGDRIAVLWTRNIRQNLPDGTSFLNFRDWQAQTTQFAAMAAYIRPEFTRGTLTGGGQAERVPLGIVGPGFFELLGTPPLLGRTFEPADFREHPTVIVIGHRLWRQRFASDAGAIGRTIQVDGRTVEIVGVMPPEFALPTPEVQVWQPLWFFGPDWHDERNRGADSLVVIGRLTPSATIASARVEMDAIAARLQDRHPRTNSGLGVSTDPLVERVVGPATERALWLLFGSVGFVLLIACANVTSLVLARAASRTRELSLRTALGASRRRLVWQALAESLALAILATGASLLIACLGTIALRALSPGALPRADFIRLDGGVLLFLLAAALASGLLAGLLPAFQVSATNPADVLREGGPRSAGTVGGRRLHRTLVIVEMALAVILLAGAGLLIRSFLRVNAADRGFDSRNVLLLQIDLPDAYDTVEKTRTFYVEAMRKIRAIPGVQAAGAIGDFFIHRQPDIRVAIEGQPPRRPEDPAPPLTEDVVVPGYFEAMRIPLRRGRLLADGDFARDAPRVVVINEEMARRFFQGQDPIGRRLKYGNDPGADRPWKTVVGVAADMRRQRLDEPAIPYMFQPGVGRQMDLAVRTAGDPVQWREAVRNAIRDLDPAAPPYGVMTIEERFGQTVALRRLQTLLLTGLAGLALFLAVVGAYAVIRQSVAARTQEIGIRLALGADQARVARMVLAEGLAPAALGLALGLLGALLLGRAIRAFLYETSALDPLVYAGVAIVLLAVTTLACLAPAWRAAHADPMMILRQP